MNDVYETQIRVRYRDCDQQGVVHHTLYGVYFEIGRTEMFRQMNGGFTYRDFEQAGYMFVVVSLNCKFHKPARYDDLLTVKTRLGKVTRVKIELLYEIFRGDELLTTGSTVLATINRTGSILPVPDSIARASAARNSESSQL